MDISRINYLITHEEQLSRETLFEIRKSLSQEEFNPMLRLIYLKNLHILHDSSFGEELRRNIIYFPDRIKLFCFLEGSKVVDRLKKKGIDTDKVSADNTSVGATIQLIDAFLENYPCTDVDDGAPKPVVDYLSIIEKEYDDKQDATEMRGQSLIDNFIEKSSSEVFARDLSGLNFEKDITQEQNNAELESQDSYLDDSFFTESLAKIYIKQGKYHKAIEIIKKLSLNYPKKSIYFAEQIKELEELIINTQNKNI